MWIKVVITNIINLFLNKGLMFAFVLISLSLSKLQSRFQTTPPMTNSMRFYTGLYCKGLYWSGLASCGLS